MPASQRIDYKTGLPLYDPERAKNDIEQFYGWVRKQPRRRFYNDPVHSGLWPEFVREVLRLKARPLDPYRAEVVPLADPADKRVHFILPFTKASSARFQQLKGQTISGADAYEIIRSLRPLTQQFAEEYHNLISPYCSLPFGEVEYAAPLPWPRELTLGLAETQQRLRAQITFPVEVRCYDCREWYRYSGKGNDPHAAE